jgi:hypothetical protein
VIPTKHAKASRHGSAMWASSVLVVVRVVVLVMVLVMVVARAT